MKQMAPAGTRPTLVEADISREAEVETMVAWVLSEYGRQDCLVNNAWIQVAQDAESLPVAGFDKVLAVNLRGAFRCVQQAVRHFLEPGTGRS